jgi:hypothetical protein
VKGDRDPRNGEYRTLTAEHADGWHNADAGGPRPGCPECRREAKAAEAARLARLKDALDRRGRRY